MSKHEIPCDMLEVWHDAFYNGKRASDKCKHVNSQDNQLYLMDSYLCNNYVHIIHGFSKSPK